MKIIVLLSGFKVLLGVPGREVVSESGSNFWAMLTFMLLVIVVIMQLLRNIKRNSMETTLSQEIPVTEKPDITNTEKVENTVKKTVGIIDTLAEFLLKLLPFFRREKKEK